MPVVDLPACRLLWGDLHVIGDGWRHSLNDPFWRLYRNLDPGAALVVGGRRLAMAPGVPVLIPPWTACRSLATGRVRHAFIHFDADPGDRATAGPLFLPPQPEWEDVLGALPFPAPLPAALALRCQAVLCSALALATVPGTALRRERRFAVLLAWIDANLAGPLPVPSLARRCGLGREHFTRAFTAATGIAPAAYVQRRRVARAAELLRGGDDTLDAIAAATGFADRYHLGHVFRRVVGIPPAAYRG